MIHIEEKFSASEEDVIEWCQLSDDSNPVHLDEVAAADSMFGERVVPGIMALGWVSGCIEELRKKKDGAIVLTGFDATFKEPIYLDERVKVVVKEEDNVVEFAIKKREEFTNDEAVTGTAGIYID